MAEPLPAPDEPALESRYDAMAAGYARWWAPVIRPAAERVLEHLSPAVAEALAARRSPRLLDVGSGTGTLAIAALERWPRLQVVGIDPSAGMLEVARQAAAERLDPAIAARYRTEVAWADEIDRDDGAFDLAVSSFVLQLVPSRAAALREVRRVLRRGGTFAWVIWQLTDRAYAPDRIANEVFDEAGFEPPEPDPRPGDVASPAAAALAMRRAGFRAVRAWAGEVEHAWTAREYVDFLSQFDEATLFEELGPDERERIEGRLLERLSELSATELTLRLPIVYAMGRAAG